MLDNFPRPDDPIAVMAHKDRFFGSKALIVLGGPSGKDWQRLAKEIKPDVILTANGATDVPGAEYWMLIENISHLWHVGKRGDKRALEIIHKINAQNTASIKLVNFKSMRLIKQRDGCIPVRRKGYEAREIPEDFTLREYIDGFLTGGIIQHEKACQPGIQQRAGTVGLQLLHLAGLLGCREAHSIGFDLMLRGQSHHWYEYPRYQTDHFSTEAMFVRRRYGKKDIATRWAWIETAQYLKAIEYLFERDGLIWRDHSNGLLKLEGLQCAL